MRTVRFTRDSTQAKLHNLRSTSDQMAFQLLFQSEVIYRQQIEKNWFFCFSTSILQPARKEWENIAQVGIEKKLDEKDEEIEKLKKKLAAHELAAASLEHTLRDKLRKSLLFSEQNYSASKVLQQQAAPISVVDLNLPVEVRFARAHVIAKKAVEMEQS